MFKKKYEMPEAEITLFAVDEIMSNTVSEIEDMGDLEVGEEE